MNLSTLIANINGVIIVDNPIPNDSNIPMKRTTASVIPKKADETPGQLLNFLHVIKCIKAEVRSRSSRRNMHW